MDSTSKDKTLEILLGAQPDKAYSDLFIRHYEMLCQIAFRYNNDLVTAEQCVMDVFTKMWDRRGEIVIKTEIKYYLCVSVRNRSMDMHRKTARMRYGDASAIHSVAAPEARSDDRYHWKQALALVEEAIEQLPFQRKRIFLMSREGEMKYHEIAAELNLSVKTIETQMSRALKSLRLLRPVIGM